MDIHVAAENQNSKHLKALLRLTLTEGLGPTLIYRLLDYFENDPIAACNATCNQLTQIKGIGKEKAAKIHADMQLQKQQPEQEIAAAYEHGDVEIIPFTDENKYPALLQSIADKPPVLYVRGKLTHDDIYAVAIVGSRRCSAYGREQAGKFAAALAQAGFTIVSGGARGIDTEAHNGTLRVNGRTIVVLGCGMNYTYPRENENLFNSVIQNGGAVISEFPMNVPPSAENFPRRNRIISGLALGTLVVEASANSGALITARVACDEHNREVMAIPGRIDSDSSLGCHKIIKEGWGQLVTNTADILQTLEGSQYLLAATMNSIQNIDNKSQNKLTADNNSNNNLNPVPVIPAELLFSEINHKKKQNTNNRKNQQPQKLSTIISHHNLSNTQIKLLEVLQQQTDPVEIGELAARTGIDVSTLQADITILQIRGLIARTHSAGISRLK